MRLLLAGMMTLHLCAAAAPEYTVRVVHVYPHDSNAFTQGFEYHAGFVYEGTGIEGQSALRVVSLANGKVLRRVSLPAEYFGEGISLLKGHIYQLTWLAHKGFIYDAATLRKTGEFQYPGQGWGLTNDGRLLYMTDGTAQIRVWQAAPVRELRRITVHDGSTKIELLNELEWVQGELWANIWHSDKIARISPEDGQVLGWIDASNLLKPGEVKDPEAVLNGIAFDTRRGRLFLTGKLWPKIFEVVIVPKLTSR